MKALRVILTVFLVLSASTAALAAQTEAAGAQKSAETAAAVTSPKSDLALGLIALAAAIAIGLTALATGLAQSRIGAAGAGTIAERPESAASIIIMLAIPETMVILGFIVSVIVIFTL
jgi:V/A-type H+/Na+-transporting ATPase subunit K